VSRGRIQKALSGFYYVNTGSDVVQCRARGKFRHDGISPLVGDWADIQELGAHQGVLNTIEPRKNCFTRPAVANIDQLVILASATIPVTDPYLIDRMASIACLKGCKALVVLNKCDLDNADELYAIYGRSALSVLRVSAETGQGIEELKAALCGKLNAFTGNSGVGKSSVLNRIDPAFLLPTGEVSRSLGRGRHTTRHVEMFMPDGSTGLIDTPGFSSFDSAEMNLQLKHELPHTFPEFLPYLEDCRFIGCSHTKENGCAVLQAVRDGLIPESRHRSYVRLYEELKDLKDWQANK